MVSIARLSLNRVAADVGKAMRTKQNDVSRYLGKVVRRAGEFSGVVAHDRARARVFLFAPSGVRALDEAEFLSEAITVLPSKLTTYGHPFDAESAKGLCEEDRRFLRESGLLGS